MANKQLWHWRGVTALGEIRQGSVWAENKMAAMASAGRDGVQPLSLTRRTTRKSHWRTQYSSELMQQLATLLQAGLTLSESLMLLAEQHPVAQWQAMMQDLAQRLAHGESLSDAMQQWPEAFPPLYHTLIQAGEMTGKLDYCCAHLARQQEEQHKLSQKVKKALRYPLIILLLALLVVIGMSAFVLPEFAAIYRTFNTPLPMLTQMVMAMSAGVKKGLPLIGLLTTLPFFLRSVLYRSPHWQRLRPQLLLALPVVSGLIRGQRLSQIYTVLALTQNAGIPFLQGLESVEKTLTCPWWRDVIRQMSESISTGSAIWQAMEQQKIFTPLCKQLVRTGEVSGSLDKMLGNLAHYHSEQTQQQAETLATLLEPVMLLVTGIIIGTLVVAMYLPIFHLGDAISGG
ncbi:protein transport protein HofC [Citrobacter sp. OP27]